MRIVHKTPLGPVEICKARTEDAFQISELTRQSNLIHRTPEEIESRIADFLTAKISGTVLACVGAKHYDLDAEIIALRTAPNFENLGLGKIVLGVIRAELVKQKKRKIFALTTEIVAQKLFFPLGFIKVGIQLFGPKILNDCLKCPKNIIGPEGNHLCNEIAVLYQG
ncbi:MAG: GNAT family N-acetyltransferase [Patescibacteria group bacterium]|jgi:N-acetylglutamate synthase-like GNAT family acetyltransferase